MSNSPDALETKDEILRSSLEKLETLTSPLLIEAGFRHAFFTRLGGVSQPPFNTLSFSSTKGDDPAAVLENRKRAARHIGAPEQALYYLSQVHGTEAVVLDGTMSSEEVLRLSGDITLSKTPGVACGVRSADCVPVLLADRDTGAVAAVHSGWRGTVLHAVRSAVTKLRELIGGEGNIVAAIGPCISVCCFEVGDDVASQLASASLLGDTVLGWGPPSKTILERQSAIGASDAEQITRTRRVDLRKIIFAQLEESGLVSENIEDVPGCTVCDPLRYHSYRRDGSRAGLLLSAIVARS